MTKPIADAPLGPVIVTGGASGIGLACAELLAENGRSVAIWDLDETQSQRVADELGRKFGVAAIGMAVDVSRLDLITEAVKPCRQALGPFAGLVHAAGIDGVSKLADLTPEFWAKVMDINLRALVFIVQAILEDLKNSAGPPWSVLHRSMRPSAMP